MAQAIWALFTWAQIWLASHRDKSGTGGHQRMTEMTNQHQAQIEQIAKAHLGMETLASRNSDSLDFYDLGVGGIKAALEAAFKAGQATQVQKRPAKTVKNAPESLRKYVECGSRIDALQDRLNALRAEHADRAAADAQNWGYLGDLGSVEQLIGQATEYIGGPMT